MDCFTTAWFAMTIVEVVFVIAWHNLLVIANIALRCEAIHRHGTVIAVSPEQRESRSKLNAGWREAPKQSTA